jgi:hypothetical protein
MKKLVSILAVLALSLQMATVYAAGATVTASNATGKAGDTVDVTISLADCSGWNNLNLETGYDSAVFTLVDYVDYASDSGALGATSETTDVIPFNTSWTSATKKMTYNGDLVKLSFKIADDAEPGEYPITVSFYKGRDGNYVDGKHCNYYTTGLKKTAIGLTYVNGSITVEGDEVETTLAAKKADGAVSITATGAEITGKFIVAGYDAEGLVDVEVIDAAATATASVDGDTIKVMWWDSIEAMNSIAPAVTL